jgi:hypothetical protein
VRDIDIAELLIGLGPVLVVLVVAGGLLFMNAVRVVQFRLSIDLLSAFLDLQRSSDGRANAQPSAPGPGRSAA